MPCPSFLSVPTTVPQTGAPPLPASTGVYRRLPASTGLCSLSGRTGSGLQSHFFPHQVAKGLVLRDIPQVNQRKSPKPRMPRATHFQGPPSRLLRVIHVFWKDMTGTLDNLLLAFTFELWRWRQALNVPEATKREGDTRTRISGFLWRPSGQDCGLLPVLVSQTEFG